MTAPDIIRRPRARRHQNKRIENFCVKTSRMSKRVMTTVDRARELSQNLWLPRDVFT